MFQVVIFRNRRYESFQIFSKLRFRGDVNDSAFVENPQMNSVGPRSNSAHNMALLQINSNGFHALVNPNHAHMHQVNYTQIDPQKRLQADNDFKIALIEEYGPEYLGEL